MVRPGLVARLLEHHNNVKKSPEWEETLIRYKETLKQIGGKPTFNDEFLICFNKEKDPVKQFLYQCYKEDVEGVLKDIKLCHDFGKETKSIWIYNQLLESNKAKFNGKFCLITYELNYVLLKLNS